MIKGEGERGRVKEGGGERNIRYKNKKGVR
jgi:hypothetical protein